MGLDTDLCNVAFLHMPAVGGPGLLDSELEKRNKKNSEIKKKQIVSVVHTNEMNVDELDYLGTGEHRWCIVLLLLAVHWLGLARCCNR